MDENDVEGTVRFYGTPAEEGGSGKVYMVREGLFDDVDVPLVVSFIGIRVAGNSHLWGPNVGLLVHTTRSKVES